MTTSTLWTITKISAKEWVSDKAQRLAAALSYYTLFSIAPLLLILTAIAAFFLGNQFANDALSAQIKLLMGETGAAAVSSLAKGASHPFQGAFSAVIGTVLLLLGATGVVGELKDALNTIWEVEPKSQSGLFGLVRERIFSLAMILGIGFLLLVSMVISAALSAFVGLWSSETTFVVQSLNLLVSIVVMTLLFAMMFKYLPDLKLSWRNVWIGAFITALLFNIGKTLIALYLAHSTVASSFGAAGSVVVVLVWVYYSACVFFFGAQFTQTYSSLQTKKVENDDESEFFYDPIGEELMSEKESSSNGSKEVVDVPPTEPESDTILTSAARMSGYQTARVQETVRETKKKLKMAQWIYKIVHLIGFKRSAKLGWKGYQLKNKFDELKNPDSPENTD
jgi:membrane protein